MRVKAISCLISALMIATIFVIEVPIIVNAQIIEEWVVRYDGPGNTWDEPWAITTDSSGNIYVTGWSIGENNRDIATIAYDSSGNVLWVARYDGPGAFDDYGNDIAVDLSGNVYVTGMSRGNSGRNEYTTIKYDTNGNELWVARYDRGQGGAAHSITLDSSGNVYVTGGCSQSTWGSYSDYVTVAYDSSGNLLWEAIYNGPSDLMDSARAIVTDSMGNIFVTGVSEGRGTDYDYATLAYDSLGNELWVARYNGPGNDWDIARAIALDSLGNVYVTGRSYGGDYFDGGTYMDMATIAYDSSGNELWVARYNGPGNGGDEAYDIVVDLSGNVYVTGFSYGIDTSYDYVTIAYDSSGNQLWLARFDSPGNGRDIAHDIVLDAFGNVIITGSSGRLEGPLVTEYDYATVAYDSSGNELWSAIYDGPGNGFGWASAICVDVLGNVYVTGNMYADYLTIKYSPDYINIPPVADIKSSKMLYEGDIVLFDGTASYDPDGIIINYTWEFGDGTFGYGVLVSHTYHILGIYSVNLTVTDNDGANNTDSCYVTILPKILTATIDIDPNTLNLKSKGRWITCYIALNDPYDAHDIDISTILLEDTIPAEWGDIQNDTLMVKFDRSKVEDMLLPGTYNLKVTGELADGTSFEGYSDEIRVIDPGK